MLATWFLDFYNPQDYYRQNYNQNTQVAKTTTAPISISGIVYDDKTGESLPGAVIVVEGYEYVGAVTNLNGDFTLNNIPQDAQFIKNTMPGKKDYRACFVGGNYAYQEIAMQNTNEGFEDVVVTSLDVMREPKAIGYAVISVDDEEFTKTKDRKKGNRLGKGDKNERKEEQKQLIPDNEITKKQTSVEYILEKPYTINSDAKNHTVDIKIEEVEAEYVYYCVPKLENTAFLTAKIADWEMLNLLSGNANLFFENSYVGSSFLDAYSPEDTLIFFAWNRRRHSCKTRKIGRFHKKTIHRHKYSGNFCLRNFYQK